MSWLLVLGVFAGLGLRAFSSDAHPAKPEIVCQDPGHDHGSEHDHDSGTYVSVSGDPHHHHGDSKDSHGPGEPCPLLHQHCSCGGAHQLTADGRAPIRLAPVMGGHVALQWIRTIAPDSPVFELDKPPLI